MKYFILNKTQLFIKNDNQLGDRVVKVAGLRELFDFLSNLL